MGKRKVAIFTSGRAEYGLLRPLIAELTKRSSLDVGLFVTGMHLAHEFGYTVAEIEKDAFPIWERIEGLLAGDTESAICKSMGLTTIGISDAITRHKPDLIVLLGDRYELLAAAQAALIHNVPIAHLHGGETTEGAMDEAIRHAITKMSHLHFVATEEYQRRVIQMGENKDRVFNTGALGLDNILSLEPMSQAELQENLGLDFENNRTFIVTYHPVTLGNRSPAASVKELLKALGQFSGTNFVLTYPNSDTHSRGIVASLKEFVEQHKSCALLVESLGVRRYLSMMKIADAVVGNSSSGIIEAPSFGIPTIDIGVRQRGRVRAQSVLECPEQQNEIYQAIKKSQSEEFRLFAKSCNNPYGDGQAAPRIADQIEHFDLQGILMKKFSKLEF